MFNLDLPWKEFNVALEKVGAWLDANIETECVGLSANYSLQIHFQAEPSQEEKEAILEYWEGIDEESDEAVEYRSKEQLAADKASKRASAKAKLIALGLTEAEVKALID